jgi:hypothetical protein
LEELWPYPHRSVEEHPRDPIWRSSGCTRVKELPLDGKSGQVEESGLIGSHQGSGRGRVAVALLVVIQDGGGAI